MILLFRGAAVVVTSYQYLPLLLNFGTTSSESDTSVAFRYTFTLTSDRIIVRV